MNILFSSDNNYAQHLGVAIYSLLINNEWCPFVRIFIVDNGISEDNHVKLGSVVEQFKNANLTWISFEQWKKKLNLDMLWNISISAYARLFVGSMLPAQVDRVLYLDCDVIINGSLESLWKMDMGDSSLAAVQDSVSSQTKLPIGVLQTFPYFNSGVLLINMKKWRLEKIEKKCLDFINAHAGKVVHHDQGVLNGVLKGNWYKLPIEYNLMTVFYLFSRGWILEYYGENSVFYEDNEIKYALSAPIIIHFTPSFTSRPWETGCVHPLRTLYWEFLKNTPWKGAPVQRANLPWYVRLINWQYRTFKKRVI